MQQCNRFIEIAASQGQDKNSKFLLDFIIHANENPKIRSIYRLTIYPSIVYHDLTDAEKQEYENLKSYFDIPKNREFLCATLPAINNIVKNHVRKERFNEIKFQYDAENIIGNIF